jgi:hypothetical protein
MSQRNAAIAAACLGVIGFASISRGQVVINEFVYDDTGTADDREFIELYNSGASPVDISGWTLGGRDPGGANSSVAITAGTVLNPGAYYVVGNTGTLNANQTVSGGFLENDNETIELLNGATLVDAVAYETNKGVVFAAPVSAQVGPGVFSNSQGIDLVATPLNASVSIGRFVDGRDSNNNGRDFGMRPSTPGTANNTGFMSIYAPPDPTGQTVGTDVTGLTGSFVNARFINPTVADANNPNVIIDSPTPGRAIVAWDSSGGGNGVTSNQVFNTKQSGFNITAYLETADMPQNFNNAAPPVNFLGSEITLYGIGSGDALTNLTDLTGALGLGSVALPAAESANGFTGYAWLYERTAQNGATPPSEKLHLVNANDGGDSDAGGNTALDWTILQTVDLSSIASGWFDLSILIDAAGNGIATFNGQTFNFTADAGFDGAAFNVGYRENLQLGADVTPDALMRPPTFTVAVPEPASLALLGLGSLALLTRRRRV